MSAEYLCEHVQEGKLDHVYEFSCCGRRFKTYHFETFRFCPFCGERVEQCNNGYSRWSW